MIFTTPIHPTFVNKSILPCDSASMIVTAASQSNHLLIAKSQHQAKMESSQTLVYVFPNQPRVFTTTRVTVVTIPLELAATVVLNKTVFLGNPPPSLLRCNNCSHNCYDCVVNQTQQSCLRCHSLNIPCDFHPPLPMHLNRHCLLCRNCYEFTKSHRKCSFSDISSESCVRCQKMHLSCYFKLSGKLILVIVHINYDMLPHLTFF